MITLYNWLFATQTYSVLSSEWCTKRMVLRKGLPSLTRSLGLAKQMLWNALFFDCRSCWRVRDWHHVTMNLFYGVPEVGKCGDA